jgi:hypothetical protein
VNSLELFCLSLASLLAGCLFSISRIDLAITPFLDLWVSFVIAITEPQSVQLDRDEYRGNASDDSKYLTK